MGAPVVFFLGTFIFTIVATLSNLGDNDTSLALAFGMWYMVCEQRLGLHMSPKALWDNQGVVVLIRSADHTPYFDRFGSLASRQ